VTASSEHGRGVKNAVAVVAGLDYSCALLANGTVECWGENEEGQLGDGTKVGSSTPVVVKRLRNVVAIGCRHDSYMCAAGRRHGQCWGLNLYGEWGTVRPRTCWRPSPSRD